ncbi:MAG: hypothetical protein EOP32_28330 [Rhodococcus sp. (in: high G+C Gram-positive bacteria)]|nr:MAG: hypothetical protein EOP32_28330 [Rhodococcus sp. (in: high G+C Gram-positive bacteria)]
MLHIVGPSKTALLENLPEPDGGGSAGLGEASDRDRPAARFAADASARFNRKRPFLDRPPSSAPQRSRGELEKIRDSAIEQGYAISSRGRIPSNVEQAFRDDHQPPTPSAISTTGHR